MYGAETENTVIWKQCTTRRNSQKPSPISIMRTKLLRRQSISKPNRITLAEKIPKNIPHTGVLQGELEVFVCPGWASRWRTLANSADFMIVLMIEWDLTTFFYSKRLPVVWMPCRFNSQISWGCWQQDLSKTFFCFSSWRETHQRVRKWPQHLKASNSKNGGKIWKYRTTMEIHVYDQMVMHPANTQL